MRQRLTPTDIKRWFLGVVLVFALSPLLMTVYTYTRAGESARVHAATASTLNFQARLLNSTGSLVNDGNYSVQFKLYTAVSGGTNEWTETQTVTVKNGYFNVYLGNVTPFGASIDWSQEKWLTMNVNSDGEMSPRIKLTATPYSLRSGQADSLTITGGTITGDNLFQKAPGSVEVINSANSGLRFNQTGAGGLLQLQGNGSDVFTVSKTGNVAASGSLVLGAGATLGNSSSTTAGTLRWSGTDFEGYDGFLWKSLTGGGSGIGTPFVSKTKTANETVTATTTFQDDDQLFFAVGANETWNFRFVVQGNAPAAADFKFAVTAPSGATCTVSYSDPEGATSVANLGCGVTTGLVPGNGAADTYEIIGSVANGATAGNVRLQWSQQVASGTTTVYTGSYVEASRSLGGSSTAVSFIQDGNSFGANAILGTNDGYSLNFETNGVTNLTLDTSGNLNIVNGALQTGGTTRITNSGVLQNVTADTSILTSGTLSVQRGGTGAGSFTTNGLLYGNGTGTLGATAAGTGGQLVIADGSGVPTFVSLGGDATLSNTGSLTIANGAIGNTKLANSSFNVSYGTNLSGDASVTLGGTLNLAMSANPTFTTVTATGAISAATTTDTINGLIINSGTLSGVTGISFTSGNLTLNNGSISGVTTLAAGSGTFNVNASGDVTGAMVALNGSSTANGAGTSSTSLTLLNATNFDIGNYVRVSSANCGGAGVNPCYAKITNKVGNVLTIAPALTWANGSAVAEYHIPEIGGTNTGSTLANRFGRGYFISGVAAGNGTTFYNEDSIETNLSSFDLLNTNVTTLNFGGAATTLNIGAAGTTVNVLGNLATSSSQTITAGGGLSVSNGGANISGGINNNSGGITATGSLAGVTTISASGAITAATTVNTINGLIINSGSLSGITGFSQTSGTFSVTGSGAITLGGGSNALTIDSTNFDVSSTGVLSGITTISASGAITAATATNTINGLIINAGSLSGITGFAQTSGSFSLSGSGAINLGGGSNALTINSTNFDVSSTGALSGITSLAASGAISAATTTDTINGLIVNSGSLSAITGFAQSSGNFAMSGAGTFGTGSGNVSLNGATTITTNTNSANALTVNGTTGTAADALRIAQTGNAANLVMTNTARTGGALISMTHSTSAFTGTGLLLNFASGSGSFASGNFLDFQLNGSSRFKVDNTGALQINSDSVSALQVRSSSGALTYLTVNNSGNIIQVGSSSADATSILFALDHGTSDPTGVNGGMYYNSTDSKNRCYEGGAWTDCLATAVVGETTLGAANGTINVTLNRNVEYLHCRVDIKSRSGASTPWLRFNNDTGAAAYNWNLYGITAAAVIDAQDNSDGQIDLASTGSTIPFSADINITNFSDTRKAVEWTAVGAEAVGTNMNRFSGGATWANTSSQITSVQFVASTGTFSAGSHAWCEGRNVR